MNEFDSIKPVKTLLAEYVDGGPGCIRDDCDIRVQSFGRALLSSEENVVEDKVNRCISCGKSWTEKFKNGLT